MLAAAGIDGIVRLWWGTTVDGGPLKVVVTPADVESGAGEATPAPTEASASTTTATCTITAPNNLNLRSGPGTNFDYTGSLSSGQTAEVNGQTQGVDGLTWYRLTDGN